ncbi:MAG: tetratricopeptide repeat protein [Deltaproteobacteria bacterium]|nr:tetratricopeptide repeat protein [Deltaproteobacteria bacterium]
MKKINIKRLLSAGILVGFLFGTSSAHSEETTQNLIIPPSIQKTTPSKPNRVKPGEEIPNWVARWELARVLSYAKRYDESIIEYGKVLKEKPGLVEAKVEMAKVLFWKGDQKAAVRILEQIPTKDMAGDTQVLMADLLVAQKNYAKAEPLYKAYLAAHPEDQATRLKLAEMLSWQKKYDASLAEYRKILKARPDDVQVRRRYAFVLIWAGKHSEAASELKKTLN